LLGVEGSVSSGNLWVKDEDLFWLWVSLVVESGSNGSGGFLVGTGFWCWVGLEKGSGDWCWWVKNGWVGWGDVSTILVWLSGGWLGVVMWDRSWLFSSAWGSGGTIHWSVGSIADGSSAVGSIKSVGSSADWEWSGRFDNNWDPLFFDLNVGWFLVIVIFISFHDDVLTEILISVHSGGEEHVIADNTFLS
jgi:hypothetical protein